jgi:GGDEF domain-containing protein
MDPLVAGFWGVFFGTAGLMLTGAVLAFARSRHRVPLRAAVAAVVSAVFAAAYIGVLPIADRALEQRVLAHVAAVSFAQMTLLLLALLGLTREPGRGRLLSALVVGAAVLVVLAGWGLAARQALALSSFATIAIGLVALPITIRRALRGDRLAWLAFAGMFFVDVTLVGLTWIALEQVHAWPLHAVSALAGTAYLATFSAAVWARYSYLLELREVMAHGPSYDPVTRMRSHAETGQMLWTAFRHKGDENRPIGILVLSIGNFYALEQLHGRGAVNHALFVCASRLRRTVPADMEMGRLGEDGFLLLTRDYKDPARLVAVARRVATRLQQPVSLSTSDPTHPEAGRASWVADLGVGVLAAATPILRPSAAVDMARAMSRTAWTFPSRIAWFDRETRQIAELPLTDSR